MAVTPKPNRRAVKKAQPHLSKGRFYFALLVVFGVFGTLVARAAYIQLIEPERLIYEGDLRSLRTNATTVQRGSILDRNGRELAVSVPVQTVWADPKRVHEGDGLANRERWLALAEVFRTDVNDLMSKVADPTRRFVYLERKVTPGVAEFVRQLDIPGVYLKTESRRFYPAGEIAAHVVGFTDIDGLGIEGLEAIYNQVLTGVPGERVYRKDAAGRVVEEIRVTEAQQPQQLTLSIDQRLQSLAYAEVKKAVRYHQATSGSAVILDVKTGEVLAMVNSPSYNPNNRHDLQPHKLRNRAITDAYEPGSTVKPLAVIAGLEAGVIKPNDVINTSPGWLRLGGRRVSDPINRGEQTITQILENSSNVGTAKIALATGINNMLDTYAAVGFGNDTGVAMLGESFGILQNRQRWSDFEIATLSYGYGMSATTLQLAQMYAIIANGGKRVPLTIQRREGTPEGEQVISASTAETVLGMLESVVANGSGKRAQVRGYRVAGKTGTSRKAIAGGYGEEYVTLFAGIAPVSNPRLAVVVTVNEPSGDEYYGSEVSAPVFSEIVGDALRVMNIPPDNLADAQLKAAGFGGADD
ncbi:peptidoglycan D,D-transpeptidase FtsI family protein [Pseudidiomarina andamanensis]|uniref:Peptidoglycan D,D-transpeptidase FtsI n=1 Tax=Pseudidiomarina andamanensis TaxID=1940690 RepID=A0AA92EU63_9GAMM|nr:penicillin-binding transpeptidase domain-containing protein [Pseudidiomarina andamanensis]MDS0217598.1 penicillin-binding transpeptidase domain-containing protein [Pseudidiomarina andamanensis]QGT96592.1 peptidoglycan glycosyltransferase FtsI [Pseudidiomarina andamanensis]